RSNLCWACADLSDSILIPNGNSQAEVESILQKGLEQVAIIRKQDPSSTQAREVSAFLQLCLAESKARAGRVGDSVGLFRQAMTEIESLCVEFPWNGQYWELARYFQREEVRVLKNAQRQDAAAESIEQMFDWLQKTSPALPNDPVSRTELQHCQT